MRFGDLPRAARIYVALVCGLALAQVVLATAWSRDASAPLELVVLLGLAAALAHTFPITTPGKQTHVSLPFMVAAIVLLTPTQIAELIVFVHVADWLRHRHQRSRFALAYSTGAYVSAAL